MPFELKNSADNTLLHGNDLSGEDFNSEELVEDTLHINLPLAGAEMKQWYFDGIRMGYHHWNYKQRMTLDWKGDLDMVTLYFNMKGNTTIYTGQSKKPFELGPYQHNLFYSQTGEGTLKNEDLQVNTFMIQFNRDAFIRITQGANELLKRFGDQVIQGKTVTLSDHNLYMDISMIQSINSVVSCKYQRNLKKLFLLSKSMELLVLQAETCRALQKPAAQYLKTEYDKERVIYARDYIAQHLDKPPGLIELARICGINEYKLKRGFKELFGNTVFGYLAEMRLELAKTDLLEKKKTVGEIAFELGYSSIQHFSSAFKKKFGVSPTQCQ